MSDKSFKEKGACLLLLTILLFSIAITAFADDDAALIKRALQILGPLPASMQSAENPITPEKVKLGKILFYEPRISGRYGELFKMSSYSPVRCRRTEKISWA